MNNEILELSDDSFENDVIKSTMPILVDFWAEWCAPCRMIAPILDELATEYKGKLTIGKLNIDNNPNVPTKHNVRGIPTLLLFKDGDIVGTSVGALSKAQLVQFIDEHI